MKIESKFRSRVTYRVDINITKSRSTLLNSYTCVMDAKINDTSEYTWK